MTLKETASNILKMQPLHLKTFQSEMQRQSHTPN